MFTSENLMIAVIAIGVLFLILGLLVLSNTHKLLKNQHKDFELLVDFIEEQFREIRDNLDIISHQIRMGDLPAVKIAINTILENQKEALNAKASISISAKGEATPTQQIHNNLNLTEENIKDIVSQLKPLISSNTGTVETSTILLSAIAVTEVVLQELHDVESIYDEKGAVLKKINEDYTKTYDAVFKTLTEQLL